MFMEQGSLGEAIMAGEVPILSTFGGQDPQWHIGLAAAMAGSDTTRRWCGEVVLALRDRLLTHPDLAPGFTATFPPPEAWFGSDPAEHVGTATDPARPVPAPGDRAAGPWCIAGTLLSQLANARRLHEGGFGPPSRGIGVVAGLSAGLLSAWGVARHGSEVPVDSAVDLLVVGVVAAEIAGQRQGSVPVAAVAAALRGDPVATPMLAVAGPTAPALAALLDPTDSSPGAPAVALRNAWDRAVLSGSPSRLAAWQEQHGGRAGIRTEFLPSSAGYHHHDHVTTADEVIQRLAAVDLRLDGPLGCGLVDPGCLPDDDGDILGSPGIVGDNRTETIVRSLCQRPVQWPAAVARVLEGFRDEVSAPGQFGPVVVDVGPSPVTAVLTRRVLRGTAAVVVAAGERDGLRSLSLAAHRPRAGLGYERFLPRIGDSPERPLRTRHTDWSGRSPVILAGMTPTTVDAEIVAAAANAGHVAELAGGGQVSPAILAERLEDLAERLTPGVEVVFNALHLDPYLWGMHLGSQKLVQRHRRDGAPVCGVTISAGVPDVEPAADLLDELASLGIWLNAFKPGDAEQVERVLQIAQRSRQRIWLHLEGGLAGGHHGTADVEQLLFATYDRIRSQENTVLCVGGGVDGPERVAELLSGDWALRHGMVAMPVDAVLIGTLAMATSESAASASVKQALVAAPGTSGAIAPGEVRGGVTSGRSSLGADIHYLWNPAAATAAMLEEVAGDPEAVQRRREEIVEALGRTAKPYFGDLQSMTHAEVLLRFVELCARGRDGRYEDGRWFDRTHRETFLRLLRRAEARCAGADEGPIVSAIEGPAALDHPEKAVDALVEAYPLLARAELDPSDAAHFIDCCDAPGKPLPFVAALDGDVRRRYLADSLWQSHSDLWNADQVLVIPGPRAVGGIEEVDQPVAELLGCLEREAARLIAGTPSPGTTREASGSADPLEVVLWSPTIRIGSRAEVSWVHRIGPADAWERTGTDAATLRCGAEVAELVHLGGGVVRLGLRWPALAGVDGDGSFAVELQVTWAGGVPIVAADPASLVAAQRRVLDMMVGCAVAASEGPGALDLLGNGTAVPDTAMVTAWAHVFDALAASAAAEEFLSLVHLDHDVRLVPADALASRPAGVPPVGVDTTHTPAGIVVSARTALGPCTITDNFLIRHPAASDAPPAPEVTVEGEVATPRRALCSRVVRTPLHTEVFAARSGDANPLHRSTLVARLAGFDRPIVHGMWTSAAAQDVVVGELLGGDPDLLRQWSIRFLGALEPGSDVTVDVVRVGVVGGDHRVEVSVSGPAGVVAIAQATLAARPTAWVFPGQGVQTRGMGLDCRSRSAAAGEIWARADALTRSELGFSVLDVVARNPETLVVDGVVHRHPQGVLHLTEFTQVAMATSAAAMVGELRGEGVFPPRPIVAGHSIGEYSALAAAGVLPLEALLRVVWERGRVMQRLVPRDGDGRSPFAMVVVRPNLLADPADFPEAVAAAAELTGGLCEVVNHNVAGRQYSVAGTVEAVEVLRSRLRAADPGAAAAVVVVPGIDVPFHSSALLAGVPSFRDTLDREIAATIDPAALVDRWVPNLVPTPFSLERDWVESVNRATGGRACADVLHRWDELAPDPPRLAREIVVELLAWQFASPVQWVGVTDSLLASPGDGGLGVATLVEVGPGTAPTLTGMFRSDPACSARLLHVEVDHAEVTQTDAAGPDPAVPDPAVVESVVVESVVVESVVVDRSVVDPEEDWDGDAPGPRRAEPAPGPDDAASVRAVAAPVPTPSPGPGAGAVADVPVTARDATTVLLAWSAGLRVDELGEDSVDRLVDGASSRRNQVLMDLGREFGLGGIDGAHEVPRAELAGRVADLAGAYRFPGPVLDAAVSSAVSAAAGRAGGSIAALESRVRDLWGLGEGWVQRCRIEVALGTRDGSSRRGAELRTLDASALDDLVDTALARVAEDLGVELVVPGSTPPGSATIDAQAVAELTGSLRRALSDGTERALEVLGADPAPAAGTVGDSTREMADRLAALDKEHGPGRAAAVRRLFHPARIAVFDSAAAWARADLDHLFHDPPQDPDEAERVVGRLAPFVPTDPRMAATLQWYMCRRGPGREWVQRLAERSDALRPAATRPEGPDLSGRVVLVSGASPASIAEGAVMHLLAGGATVVVLTSGVGARRRRSWRDLYRRHGGPGSRLVVVPVNLASFGDIDAVLDWLTSPGDPDHPGLPDVVLPFAAPQVLGEAPDSGPAQELELRVMLLGVERLVASLAQRCGARSSDHLLTAVLPMSPNHGLFGGDGAYGHAKAGLEVLESRRFAEHDRWGRWCRIIGATIGWVRGTSLMAANDHLAPVVEQRLGIRTFSAQEMGGLIAGLCAPDPVGLAAEAARADFTGGLGDLADPGTFASLLRNGLPSAGAAGRPVSIDDGRTIEALPTPRPAVPQRMGDWPGAPTTAADDMVVICGVGEVGPWGLGDTRADIEQSGSLGARSILLLAQRCGLIDWVPRGSSGDWVDAATGDPVVEEHVAQRYRDEVMRRCGLRRLPEGERTHRRDVEVFTERSTVVDVADAATAEAFRASIPGAEVVCSESQWQVRLPAGSPVRVGHDVTLPRSVAAPIPEGMTPARVGVPPALAASVDPLAAWNLAASAAAFLDAGCAPEELLEVVHPAMVGCTQGTGMGGMTSLRAMHLDPRAGTAHANDLLQEALANVPAAHAMQTLVGGYGPMVHPVGACATAAVSLESAMDLIRLGKADAVLAGGIDDLAMEGIVGFADMAATADDAELAEAGFEPSEMSRPGDAARAGFVEGQGGGAFLVCRGRVARELGLPVRAVVGFVESHADGLQVSIPAPGPGALAVCRGGPHSPLARALAAHGLHADDIALVSKHDTSTRANDPNEAALHDAIAASLGRSPGNPLRVVSQKALTGHAKGGAAAWQVAGMCDIFETGVVPGNPNLDRVDPAVQPGPHLVLDHRPLRLSAPPRAALVTSLGFGHVSAVVLLVHPDAFHCAVAEEHGAAALADHLRAAHRRRVEAARVRAWEAPAVLAPVPTGRRLPGTTDADRRRAETEMLVDLRARSRDGVLSASVAGTAGEHR